jgi:predicted dithiol-disulfide oxidoreductase (DUF899 family)
MHFPNETSEYRAARDALLASEIALRRQMEAVAAQLRALPQTVSRCFTSPMMRAS